MGRGIRSKARIPTNYGRSKEADPFLVLINCSRIVQAIATVSTLEISHRIQSIPLPDNPSSRKDIFEKCKDDELSLEDSLCSSSDVLMLMDALWLPMKEDLYLSLIKVCVESKDSSFSAALYAQVRQTCPSLLRYLVGLLLANRFLQLFVAYCYSSVVLHLFDQMPLRDDTSFAVVISSLSYTGSHHQSL
ncbi:hypothetical protein ZIOFF_073013 [Zingiber officinale]|uniref:Uncharacterized protein n=1 Tax=Zingiber officinale TaxID=94328 RepID=A0A8J5C3C4_ZINOF|nr:hypothetical protein ZIOFF_073013 [Zingiber officinale]